MKNSKLIILGSTGSIGTQTLEIVRAHTDSFQVAALSAHSNWKRLAQQINEFKPDIAYIGEPGLLDTLKSQISHSHTKILSGNTSDFEEFIAQSDADTVVNSLVGFSGFRPTLAALSHGKKVALANKESLVVGGALLEPYINEEFDNLIPIDSEHSAILQCLAGEPAKSIKKLIITASGGPFRTWPLDKLDKVTVKEALNHPNWNMGSKITIDSATMMNKGLEVIEAHWLFQLPVASIETVVHPQSIIHSMVVFTDGSIKSQMGLPDMRLPIQYALSYPDRWPLCSKEIDWSVPLDLSFEPVDYERFPCFKLAIEALDSSVYGPTIMNAANEVAVERFLKEEIPYIRISDIVADCMAHISSTDSLSIESLEAVDQEARVYARHL
ncbi:1-deoxy-D-xylulose-5-phosphate reductoisomerase [Balneolaceae bacterium ANBcel3]|nr:1-deoxy-D-xylulose-5-phosphate reductoisomerase [Balneolaceae bacterium ANBcel3]